MILHEIMFNVSLTATAITIFLVIVGAIFEMHPDFPTELKRSYKFILFALGTGILLTPVLWLVTAILTIWNL